MSYGLRVWDASGNLVVEVTDRIPKYEAIYTVPSLSSAGSTATVTHPGFSLGTHYFSTNMPWNVEAIPQDGKIVFRKWVDNSASGNFSVIIYQS